MLDRSIPTREASLVEWWSWGTKFWHCSVVLHDHHSTSALVHSIPISEVKDMKSDVFWALKASLSKKYFEPCLEAQL
jgi:hypothetical protein